MEQLRYYFRMTCFVVACVCAARDADAHPISYTDAWVRVGSTIEVKLNVFLDDVLRHQNLLPDAGSLISSRQVHLAVGRHAEILQQQLQILSADGRPLQGHVVQSPVWVQRNAHVDLSIDGSLKLQWKLRFAFDTAQGELLTFCHQFTHPDLDQAGELRLHLQHQPTRRRIDATIPAGRPHTIYLPVDHQKVAGREINDLVARMILGPAHFTLEVYGPSCLLPNVLPIDDTMLSEELMDARLEELEKWAKDSVRIEINERSVEPVAVLSELTPMVPETKSAGTGEPDENLLSRPLTLTNSLAGVRLVFVRPRNISSARLLVDQWPGEFREASLGLITPSNRSSQFLNFDAYDSADGTFEYLWLPESIDEFPTDVTSGSLAGELVTRVEPNWKIPIAALLGALLSLGFAGRRKRVQWRRSSILTTLIMAVLISVCAFKFRNTKNTVDELRTGEIVERALETIYQSLQLTSDKKAVEALSMVLQPDVLESVYVNAVHDIANRHDNVVSTIRSVDIGPLNAAWDHAGNGLQVDCEWTVNVTVEHWSHSHDRNLVIGGTILLQESGDIWKVSDFQSGEVKYTDNS